MGLELAPNPSGDAGTMCVCVTVTAPESSEPKALRPSSLLTSLLTLCFELVEEVEDFCERLRVFGKGFKCLDFLLPCHHTPHNTYIHGRNVTHKIVSRAMERWNRALVLRCRKQNEEVAAAAGAEK